MGASPYSVVLFDAYDTLWHSTRTHAEVWRQILMGLGHNRRLEDIRNATASAQGMFMPRYRAFETSGNAADPSELLRMWEEWDIHVLERLGVEMSRETIRSKIMPGWDEDLALYPETVDVLGRLRSEGYRLAMVSNGVNHEESANSLGIADHFEVIVGSAHVGFKKPMPQIFELALSRLEIEPGHAVMVGDNWEDDVEGARGAGIRGIHLDRETRLSPGSDVVADLWGVAELLRSE